MATGAGLGFLVSNPYLGALIGVGLGVFGADELSAESDHPLERQREDLKIQRMLEEARRMNEELDYICQPTGGCDNNPGP